MKRLNQPGRRFLSLRPTGAPQRQPKLAKLLESTRENTQRRPNHWFEALEPRLAMAAIQDWFERGVGGGGALFSPSINPANSDEMYIASDMGQVFRTTNEGENWKTVDFREIQGSNNSKMQFTVDPQILYSLDYSTGGDFIRPTKSTDGGLTWTPLAADPTGAEAFTVVADYHNPNRLIVSDYNRIWISTDGGQSFQQRYSTSNGQGAHVGGAFFDGNNIYIGTNQGVLVSTNGGATFNLASWGGIPAGQSILSFAGAKEGGVTRFWVVTAESGDVYAGVPGSDHWGYSGIYRIDVGQSSWQQVTSGIASGAHPFFVSSTLNDIDTVYVAGGSESGRPTVFKSTSGGTSWSSVLSTINNGNVQTGWSGDGGNRNWTYGENAMGFTVDLFNPNRLVITDYGFAHMSEDGGATWRALYVNPADLNPAGANIPAGETYRSSGLDNTTSWGVTWASANHLIANNSDIRGQQSNDGGQSWNFNYTGHTANSMYRSIVHPTTGVIYAATASVHDMYQSTHLTDSAINGGTGSVLFSTNGGTTWQTMRNFGRVVTWVEADPTNPNRLYASVAHSTDGGIYVTNNASAGAAATWTKLANPPRTEGHAFNIRVLDDGTIVASYSGRRTGSGFTASSGVFVSTNGGASWQDRSHSGMLYWTKDVVIDPHDASQNTWYATVFSGWGGAPNGLGGLYKTTNRGQTWTRINNLDRVNSITVSPTNPSEAYLTTEVEGLWYTENLNAATPTFTQVDGYTFMQPMRVDYNPYDPNEVWVTSFGGGLRVGYVTPEEPEPEPGNVSIAQPTYTVSEDGGSLLVSVSRSGGSAGAVSVQYSTLSGTAIAGQDFTATSGLLSWGDGETGAKTFSIPLINDTAFEPNETFSISLSNPTGGLELGAHAIATVTLTSEDAQPLPGSVALSQPTYTVSEDGGSLLVSVSRSGGTAGAVSVSYATANGTATAGQDYTTTSGTLSWAAGEGGAKTFSIPLINDSLVEGNETLTISLSGPTGGLVLGSPASATVTITSDDAQPLVSFTAATIQVQESVGQAVVTVIRSGNTAGAVTVAYAAAPGTATSADFTPTSGVLSFADGETEKTFTVAITNDTADELLESIQLSLSNPTGGAALGTHGSALLQILDNDDPPPASNSNFEFEASLFATREDYGLRTIYIQRNGDLSQPGSVQYTTRDGSATGGSDYLAITGTVEFAPGERVKKFDVRILQDAALEPTEELTVELSSPVGGSLGTRAVSTIRIVDDEVNAPGTIQFDRATYETQENWGYANIYVERKGGAEGAVSATFTIAPGTAQPGQDYIPYTGTVNFVAGQKSATVRVYLVNDLQLESLENATMTLSDPTGGAILGARSTATLNIKDDEINAPGKLTFSTGNFKTQENWGYVRIYVDRIDGLIGNVAVNYSVGGGTAIAGTNYQPVSGTLTFATGETRKHFDIPLINNKTAGGNKTLNLQLSNPTDGAELGALATSVVTILDDEA
jgi:photosystem II stability/assembly factor-like uncharacterized protein